VNGSVTITQTAPVTVTAATASQLVFTQQPTRTQVNAFITPPVRVTAQDAFGNTAANFVGSVTVAIGHNGGVVPGGLHGTLVVAVVSGVATFSDLSIDQTGVGYTLVANSSVTGLTQGTSTAFDITVLP
jgi:hypothetical protein